MSATSGKVKLRDFRDVKITDDFQRRLLRTPSHRNRRKDIMLEPVHFKNEF